MTAEYKVHGDVAVITLNNPPVNGLGYATRTAIAQGINQANADAAVKAIVITGAGKAFSGGADIKEFGSPKATAEPNLLSVILTCENSSKPMATEWIAATIGLEEASQVRMTDSRLGSAVALGEPNSLMSAPPEKALPAPVMTIALTAASAFAWLMPWAIAVRVA